MKTEEYITFFIIDQHLFNLFSSTKTTKWYIGQAYQEGMNHRSGSDGVIFYS